MNRLVICPRCKSKESQAAIYCGRCGFQLRESPITDDTSASSAEHAVELDSIDTESGTVDELIARTSDLSPLAKEIQEALKTLTQKHPRVIALSNQLTARAEPIRAAIKAKLLELCTADEQLADWYRPEHAKRVAISQQIGSLQNLLHESFWRTGALPSTMDLGNGVMMELLAIPKGEFMMGSPAWEMKREAHEGPQHRVQVMEPFHMSKYEVTQAQWKAVMGENPSHFRGDDLPVEKVSWNDCRTFCLKASQKVGQEIRLPSEAEWEYSCRAGTTTPFHFGVTLSTDEASYNGDYVYGSGREGENRRKTTPVGLFPANLWGLHDMHGNVWEWCEDRYHSDYDGAPTDGSAWTSGDHDSRVLRGGSWFNPPRICRSASRYSLAPELRSDTFGFRVVSGS